MVLVLENTVISALLIIFSNIVLLSMSFSLLPLIILNNIYFIFIRKSLYCGYFSKELLFNSITSWFINKNVPLWFGGMHPIFLSWTFVQHQLPCTNHKLNSWEQKCFHSHFKCLDFSRFDEYSPTQCHLKLCFYQIPVQSARDQPKRCIQHHFKVSMSTYPRN